MTLPVALIFVAAATLRGHVPGAEPTAGARAEESPLAGVVVVGLLIAAVAVIVVAVITRLLDRTATPPRAAARSDWLRRDRGKPTWRIWLFAAGLIAGWVVLVMLLGQLGGGGKPEAPNLGSGTPSDSSQGAGDANANAAPPLNSDTGGWDLLEYFYAATVVFLLVVIVGTIVAARRRRPLPARVAAHHVDACGAASEPESESLARAAEVGLAEVGDLSRDPRRAIIACYAAMERELSLLPDAAPRDFDTASEVLARAVDHHVLQPDSATQLVDLFDEARFSPHVMNEGHRDAAVDVLTQVLGELRSHA